MTADLLLALDQGTTSTRTIAFDAALRPIATAQEELAQHFPAPGWVEHEPEDIWRSSLATLRDALAQCGGDPRRVAALGGGRLRERGRGAAVASAGREPRELPKKWRNHGSVSGPRERTGLLADPYFSATKLAWLLDHVPGARQAAERGSLAFGTIDSFLIWRLTGGRVHATDATNAARTMLFDIHHGDWDDELLRLFRIPRAVLPEVRDCAAEYGMADATHLGIPVPIRGVAGDQQAATVGQGCFQPGMVKSTYGTGCFALLNTGEQPVASRARLLTTIAYQLDGRRSYALEGAIFVAGAAVQWLRDGLGIISSAAEAGALAAQADPAQSVVMVPAFTGLGAPHWDPQARAAIHGLTRGSGRAELCRAALESVAFQTRDLVDAMRADWHDAHAMVLRVDGGMVASDWTMQFLADLLGAPVDRPMVRETTALGAAYLAGLQAGLCPAPGASGATHWRLERRFMPAMAREDAARRQAIWQDAVRRTLTH